MAADKAKLEALVSDQLSFGHSAGRIETKKDFIDVVAGKTLIARYCVVSLKCPSKTAALDASPRVLRLRFREKLIESVILPPLTILWSRIRFDTRSEPSGVINVIPKFATLVLLPAIRLVVLFTIRLRAERALRVVRFFMRRDHCNRLKHFSHTTNLLVRSDRAPKSALD